MSRTLKVHRPTTAEVQQLSKLTDQLDKADQARRAEALLLYGMGLSPREIAAAQGVHPNTIYTDLRAFEQAGLAAVKQLRGSGRPARISAEQVKAIVWLADHAPAVVGLPYGRWSVRKLQAYLVRQHIVKSIGRERVRQLLKKRSVLSPGAAQAHQSRSTTSRHSGPDSLDFQAFARRRAAVVFRCQAHRRQSLWRATLDFGSAIGVAAQPENPWALLSVHRL